MDLSDILFEQVASLPVPEASIQPDPKTEPKEKPVRERYSTSFERDNVPNPLVRRAYQFDSQITSLHVSLLSKRPSYLALPVHQTHQRRYGGRTGHPSQTSTGGDVRTHGRDGPSTGSSVAGVIPLTEAERRQFDADTTTELRIIVSGIDLLDRETGLEVKKRKLATASRRGGLLGASLSRWVAGGDGGNRTGGGNGNGDDEPIEVTTLKAFWDSVIFYLRSRLRRVMTTQAQMLKVWQERDQEKAKSSRIKLAKRPFLSSPQVLAARSRSEGRKSDGEMAEPGAPPGAALPRRPAGREYHPSPLGLGVEYDEPAFRSDDQSMMTGITPQLQQKLEQEVDQEVQQAHLAMERLQVTQGTVTEITSLMSQVMSHLSVQEEQIRLIHDNVISATDDVEKGNDQLSQKNRRPSVARRVFLATSGLCLSLVVWDLIF